MTTKKINLTVISQSMYAHFALPCAMLMSRNKNKQTQLELHLFPNSKCIMSCWLALLCIRKYNSARFTHIYWSVFVIKTMICNIFSWVELHYFFIWWKSDENLLKQRSFKKKCKTLRHCFNHKWILLRIIFVDVPVVWFCKCCLNSYCVIQVNCF